MATFKKMKQKPCLSKFATRILKNRTKKVKALLKHDKKVKAQEQKLAKDFENFMFRRIVFSAALRHLIRQFKEVQTQLDEANESIENINRRVCFQWKLTNKVEGETNMQNGADLKVLQSWLCEVERHQRLMISIAFLYCCRGASLFRQSVRPQDRQQA